MNSKKNKFSRLVIESWMGKKIKKNRIVLIEKTPVKQDLRYNISL